MFQKLSITPCEDITIRELLQFKEKGHCVQRSSHAGNWNSYKLLLSELGLPDCIWDVTCIYRDINNQPRHQLIGGNKIPLMGSNDPGPPPTSTKYLTPYHRAENKGGQTLSNFHVQPLKEMFNGVITTQSQVLLGQRSNLEKVFDVVQELQPKWLGRYVFPCGCMVELQKKGSGFYGRCEHDEAEIATKDLAQSAIATLEELTRLVWEPVGYEPKGGVIYSFELVVASFYLWAYWQFGDKMIYELSGPDMIRYATKPDFIRRVSEVLRLVGQHLPNLVPEEIEAKIVPAIFFRFGHPQNCQISKTVMGAHEAVMKIQELKRKHKYSDELQEAMNLTLKELVGIIDRHGESWDLFHQPDRDAFYSQHDLLASGDRMQIMEGFLDLPFRAMGEILRKLPQLEEGLKRRFLTEEFTVEDSFR